MNEINFYQSLESLNNIHKIEGSIETQYFFGIIPIINDETKLIVGKLSIHKFSRITTIEYEINDGPEVSISYTEKFDNEKLMKHESISYLLKNILIKISKEFKFSKTYKLQEK